MAARLVREAVQSSGEPPFPADEQEAVTAASPAGSSPSATWTRTTSRRSASATGSRPTPCASRPPAAGPHPARVGHRQPARTVREPVPAPGLTADALCPPPRAPRISAAAPQGPCMTPRSR
ncbi:hypothetical protein [Streptomyces sp. CB01635]|uniref:hypothetical protein n=1 Tax=Streptomyces sp. CB01635 TaxID=2020326 RepID=UPI003FA35232